MNKRKGNKSINIYAGGGFAKFLNKSGNSLFGSTGGAASEVGKWGLTQNGMGIANMGAGLASSIGGSLINNNDLHTVTGDIMNTVGGLASNIPGVGGIIGAGVDLAGSITNAAFGSKLNHQFINQTENKIDYQMAQNFDDSSADSLASDWNNLEMLDNVSRSQVGKDGWFSRKAKRRARKLNKQINRSNEFAVDTFDNATENLGQNTLNGHLSNYFAKGGNLNKDYPPNQPQLSQWTDADQRHSDNIKGQNSFNEFLYQNQNLTNIDPTRISTNPGQARFNYENNKDLAKNTAIVGTTFGSAIANPIGTLGGFAGGYAGAEGGNYISDQLGIKGMGKDALGLIGGIAGGALRFGLGTNSSLNRAINSNREKNRFIEKLSNEIDGNKAVVSDAPSKKINMVESKSNDPTLNKASKGSIYRTDLRNKTSKIDSYEKAGITKSDRNQPIKTNPVKGETELGNDTYLINRSNTPYDFSEGDLRWKTDKIRKTSHFTVDEPVMGHNAGNWDGATETMLTPYKQMVDNNGKPVNMDMMDTWFTNPNNVVVKRDGTKILTSDINNYKKYKSQGIDVTYNKESAKLTNRIKEIDSTIDKMTKENKTNSFGHFEDASLNNKKKSLLLEKSELQASNRKHVNKWVKDNKGNMTDEHLLKYATEGGTEGNVQNSLKYSSKDNPERYSTAPASHANNWAASVEADIYKGRGFDPKEIIHNYEQYKDFGVKEGDLPIIQRYVMESGKSFPDAKVNSRGAIGDKLNRILGGEKVYKLAMGGSLNNMKNNIFDLGGALLGPNIGGASHGADFSNGVKFIKNGGTHEQNPNQGVPIGVDQEGNPNLVEEGEVVFNDYVYSNRIQADKKFLESTNLDKKYSGKTYAYIAEKLTEESSERENDPISLNGLHANMGKLMAAQELQKQEDEMSKMTEMFDKMKDLSEEDAVQLAEDMGLFGQEEQQEYSDEMGNQIIPEDMSQKVPQGELIQPELQSRQFALGGPTNNRNGLYNRYQKSDYAREQQQGNLDIGDFNRFKTGASVPRMFDILRGYGNMSQEDKSKARNHMPTFDANSTKNVIRQDIKYGKSVAERSANIMNPYQWRVPELKGDSNLPVDKQTTDVIKPKANTAHSAFKGGSGGGNIKKPVRSIMDNIQGTTLNGLGLQQPSVSKDMKLPQYFAPPVSSEDSRDKGSSLASLRYAPIFGNISSVIQDKFNKPDYSAVDKIETAIKPVQKVTNPRLNDYMTYSPLDTDYLTNTLDLQQASNRSNIRNMSGGNRATAVAGLMASDSAHNSQRGELFRQAQDYNNAQRQKVSEFNRATNQYNADSAYRTTATNAQNTQALNRQRLGAYTYQAQLKDQIDTKLSATKSSNLSTLFNSLGSLGKDEAFGNMISSNSSLGYYLSRLGELAFKGYGGNK